MARKKDKRDISTLNNELKDLSELELLLKEKINYNNNKNTGNEISE